MYKIAIIVEAFYNCSDVDRTIDSILKNINSTKHELSVDIIVLENPSPKSKQMLKIYSKYKDHILMYLRASENIEGNIFTVFINQYRDTLKDYDYIGLTEGDAILDDGALLETVNLLNKYPKAGNCSISLSLANLQIPPLPQSARNWYPRGRDAGDHIIGATGFQFINFRRDFLFGFIDALNAKQLTSPVALGTREYQQISDSNLILYNSRVKKTWIRTKQFKLLHIGWDHYKNPKDEYWVYKTQLLKSGQLRTNLDISQVIFTDGESLCNRV